MRAHARARVCIMCVCVKERERGRERDPDNHIYIGDSALLAIEREGEREKTDSHICIGESALLASEHQHGQLTGGKIEEKTTTNKTGVLVGYLLICTEKSFVCSLILRLSVCPVCVLRLFLRPEATLCATDESL